MEILLISYNFGNTASGIITERVATALKEQGNNVIVVSSDPAYGFVNMRCKNFFQDISLLRRLSNKVYTLITGDVPKNYCWVKRAYKQSLSVIKNYKIELIYCRTSPLEACEVGYQLKCKTGINTLLHFSDPQPSALTIKNQFILKYTLKKYRKIINTVDWVSFGTEEMQRHQENLLGMNLKKKSFVSPDAASSSKFRYLPYKQNSSETVFVYLGSLTIDRDPNPLIEAIRDLREGGLNIILNIYAQRPYGFIRKDSFVNFCGRRKDIDAVLESADVLVDIDVKHEESVYISSKIKDYLLVNRPILAISKKGSPVNKLVCNSKTVFCAENNKDSICGAVNDILTSLIEMNDYKDRKSIISVFSPQEIARALIEKVNTAL